MKVAVVGCGAVGSYYGAMLARAGHDVHFLLRSDYEAVKHRGVRILSPHGDFQVRPASARRPQEIGRCGMVMIGLKTTANSQFAALLPPLTGPQTAVVTLQNGLGNEEQLARIFPAEQILGCLCFVCLNRIEPGVIRHMDHGQVVLGEFQRPPVLRTHELAEVFRHAGVTCTVTENLARTHWEKLVWNIPFNGLGVAASAGFDAFAEGPPGLHSRSMTGNLETFPTDKLLGDPRWAGLLRELMLEVIRAANALRLTIPEGLADRQLELTRTMGAYKASTLLDFEHGLPLELDGLFFEPCRQARLAGVRVPRLERLCAVLEQLDLARGRNQPAAPGVPSL